MADFNSKIRDNESGITVSIVPQEHVVKAIISLMTVKGLQGAVSTVWTGEMARDGLVTEPTVNDYLHELLHMLQELDVCPSNPSL